LIGFNVGNANVLSSIGPNIIIGTNISQLEQQIVYLVVFYLQGTHIQQLLKSKYSHKQMVELVLMWLIQRKHLRLVGGTTILYGGLTANTISATTYLNLPSSAGGSDIRVTGGTYSNGTALFTNNTGGTFNVTGFSTGSISTTTLQVLQNW
jgi:hypothetical protein